MKNKEKAEDILQHLAEDYNTTPERVRQILDEIIDRAWSEKGREAEESRLELFSEKPTAEEFLVGVLDGMDNNL